jgi:hypothetical protein
VTVARRPLLPAAAAKVRTWTASQEKNRWSIEQLTENGFKPAM